MCRFFVSIWCRASGLSVSMALECRADIHSVRASGCCRPDSPLGRGLLRFATVPERCILVYHGDRVRHQEEGTSSVISECFSLHGLLRLCVLVPSALTLLLRHAVFSCHKPLVHPWVLSYHGKTG